MKKTANSGMVFVSVLVISALAGPVSAFEDSNLVSHWRFDEGAGDIAYDSASDNHGTVHGAVWTIGQVDGALSFDGDGDYVEIPHNNNLNLVSEGTVATWVNLKSSYKQAVVTKQPSTSSGNYFLFTSSGNNMGFGITNGAWAEKIWVNTPAITNEWAFYAGTFDSSTVSFYENGVLVDSKPNTITPITTNQPLYIGKWPFSSSWDCNGSIDEVMIFNRCLSLEEIQQLYQDGLPGLVAIDIKPQSCPNPLNLKSRGVLPVAILGSEDFDVSTIDAASIFLEGVPAIRSNYEDVAAPVAGANDCECTTAGPDGYSDLTLKFRTQEIVEQLIDGPGELVDGQTLLLTFTGALYDGKPIEGADCVVLVGNVPKWLAAKGSDINGDGIVNILDFAELATYWLESSEIE